MYIEDTITGVDRAGAQVARRARFLILVDNAGAPIEAPLAMRAVVRRVALRQCGHFMMGTARAFGHSMAISGAYGHDGLPIPVPEEVYRRAVPVPAELQAAWSVGGGWNGCGSEAGAMRSWALRNLPALSPWRSRS
jgi:hypothetical protein